MGSSHGDLCRQDCNPMRLLLCKSQIQKEASRFLQLPVAWIPRGGGSKLQAEACKGMGVGWGMLQEVRFINSGSTERPWSVEFGNGEDRGAPGKLVPGLVVA